MEKIERYSCGAGDGMYDNKDGYYVKYEDYKKVFDELKQIKNHGDIGDVSISSISHVEIDKWAKKYSEGIDGKRDGFHRLDFFNGALTLKQKLEGTADEC